MKHPVRLSPDGDVAVRDLTDEVNGSGNYTWRTTRGKWLTDAEVDGWIPLAPQNNHVTVARAPNNSCWVVEHNGVHAVAAADPGLASAVALTCVQRAGGTALVTVDGGHQEFARRYERNPRALPGTDNEG